MVETKKTAMSKQALVGKVKFDLLAITNNSRLCMQRQDHSSSTPRNAYSDVFLHCLQFKCQKSPNDDGAEGFGSKG